MFRAMRFAFLAMLIVAAAAAAGYGVAADAPTSATPMATAAMALRRVDARVTGRLEALGVEQSPETVALAGVRVERVGGRSPARIERDIDAYVSRLGAYLGRLRAARFPACLGDFKRRATRSLGELRAAVGGTLPMLRGQDEAWIRAYLERAGGLAYELAHRLRHGIGQIEGRRGNDGCHAAAATPLA